MNRFEQHVKAPPTEEEWMRREEDIERTRERRLLALDLAFEYRDENAALLAETGCTLEEVC